MGKGHRKGSSFERDIARQISLWWTNGERDDVFWRTSASGARAKVRSKVNKATFGQYGDLQAVDPIGQPFIDFLTNELKTGYANPTVYDVVDKGNVKILQHWERFRNQVEEDAENAQSVSWVLITKRPQRKTMIHFPRSIRSIIFPEKTIRKIRRLVYYDGEKPPVISMKLEDFFQHAKPELIIKHMEEIKNGR